MPLYSARELIEGFIELDSGTVIQNMHSEVDCYGNYCAVHNPSEHEFRDLKLDFNGKHFIRLDYSSIARFRVDPDDYWFNINRYAILRNGASCTNCTSTIFSKNTNDQKTCRCGGITIDGGHDYIKRSCRNPEYLFDCSIVVYKD